MSKYDAVIVFASSRHYGNTRQAIDQVCTQLNTQLPIYDLTELKIGEFDYQHAQQDDFPHLIQSILNYDLIILATPVYWYSVSAKMKCFIDRLSDLLMVDKESGRQLRGKSLATIASYSVHPEGIDGFEKPLTNTTKYLGMTYRATYFHYTGDDAKGLQYSKNSLHMFLQQLA